MDEIRYLDELGRIVIPKRMRPNIKGKIAYRITQPEPNKIVLQYQPEKHCLFCNSKKNLISVENGYVCEVCVYKMLDQLDGKEK